MCVCLYACVYMYLRIYIFVSMYYGDVHSTSLEHDDITYAYLNNFNIPNIAES